MMIGLTLWIIFCNDFVFVDRTNYRVCVDVPVYMYSYVKFSRFSVSCVNFCELYVLPYVKVYVKCCIVYIYNYESILLFINYF